MAKHFVIVDKDSRYVTDDEGYIRFWDTRTQATLDATDISRRIRIELYVRQSTDWEEGCLTISKQLRIEIGGV